MVETIINEKGQTLKIRIGEDCHPVTLSKDTYCLTCGKIAKEKDEVFAISVGCAEGLKGWLSKRSHYVRPEHSVLLCEGCLDEYDSEIS